MHRKCLQSSCTLCSAVAYCCGAVALCVTAALLGRFLPRLGPLVHSSGPFFFAVVPVTPANAVASLCRRLEWTEVVQRNGGQSLGQQNEIVGDLGKSGAAFAPALIHVDRAVQFELDGVQAGGRIAVVFGDEAAGIGLVASDRIAKPDHGFLDRVGEQGCATGAVAIA